MKEMKMIDARCNHKGELKAIRVQRRNVFNLRVFHTPAIHPFKPMSYSISFSAHLITPQERKEYNKIIK
jgi:hypothetical protein